MRGAFNGFRAVAPWFRDSERRTPRRVVNIGSVAHHGGIGGANYSAAKAGLVGLTKAMADEWAAFGVTVNEVAPGFIEVGLSEGIPEETRRAIAARIPVGRAGTPEDVAAAVAFFCSPDAGLRHRPGARGARRDARHAPILMLDPTRANRLVEIGTRAEAGIRGEGHELLLRCRHRRHLHRLRRAGRGGQRLQHEGLLDPSELLAGLPRRAAARRGPARDAARGLPRPDRACSCTGPPSAPTCSSRCAAPRPA